MMRSTIYKPAFAALALTSLLFAGAPALAEEIGYRAELKGSSEVPPNDSKGTGAVEATYDTGARKLRWTITYAGLSGAATAAHFHGPAGLTSSAPPIVPLGGPLTSPIKGEGTLSAEQAEELRAGRVYFNIHTASHKDGELRGQMIKR